MIDVVLPGGLEQRFAATTNTPLVAGCIGATVAAGAVSGQLYGWAGVLPFLFILLALLGEALFVTLAAISLLAFAYIQGSGFDLDYGAGASVLLEMGKLTESPVLLAIPLFTLAGAIMTHGGISGRLVRVMQAGVGWMPGGVAIATIVACAFFAALSGSSAVTIIAIGGMLAPTLERDYGRQFSLGLLTSCGAIGILAPPSVPLIVYGVVSGVDINQLFVAGVVPGLLTISLLGAWCMFKGIDAPRQDFS